MSATSRTRAKSSRYLLNTERPAFKRAGTDVQRPRSLLLLALLSCSIAGALHAQDAPGYTQSDFGGVGLFQTPTARMAPEGELSVVLSHVQPYTNFNVSLQPLPWLEGTFRYTDVSNRLYGAIAGSQDYKDKSIDLKVRLLKESRYLPDVAVGVRDIGGTGLFSSEYVVGSKRLGAFDFSLGLGWGYIGARGNLPNPFGWIDSNFNQRNTQSSTAGGFNDHKYFRGRTALFGGVAYQTSLDWLSLKLELDGNDYQHQPQNNNQRQRTPLNFGALFRVSRNLDVSLGYERGTTLMASITLHDNLAQQQQSTKVADPLPEQIDGEGLTVAKGSPTPTKQPPSKVDWAEVSRVLQDNAGIQVNRITQRGPEIVVSGEQERFFYTAEGLGRTARVLDNRLNDSIDWISVDSEYAGLATIESSLHRSRFDDLLKHDIDLTSFRRSVEQDPITPRDETLLYQAPLKKFEGSISPQYKQSLGGPDAFILYQVTADGNATYRFNRNLWLDGTVSVNLLNNYNKFKYDAPSSLPRVRTYVREYLTTSNVTLPNFQLTGTRQLGTDLYGMAYAGMLESMFGGVGGEVLYRPFGERWAVGMDANFVRQRGFRQDFSFRNYQVATGQATLYLDTGFHGVHVALSAGRYLAGDIGGTFDVSRVFSNGVRMGAFATVTNKSGNAYGEGSFDKGIYFSIPFDLLLPRSSTGTANITWEPLLRDGGARLRRAYDLYSITSDQDGMLFNQNLDKIQQ